MTNQTRLTDELNALYANYVESINDAVAADDLALAAELADSYDRDAIVLMAEREGRQDLLSHFGLTQDGGRLSVQRDTHGVPQIWADTAEDLFRAQGYVHAQDRFWEMDFRRHVTAGRLAELFGPDQVDTDDVERVIQAEPVLQPDGQRTQDAGDGSEAD